MIIGKEFGLNPIDILNEWTYQDMLDTYSFIIYENDMQKKEYDKALKNNNNNDKPKKPPKGLRNNKYNKNR